MLKGELREAKACMKVDDGIAYLKEELRKEKVRGRDAVARAE